MTTYVYATRSDDYDQHLLTDRASSMTLCGVRSKAWRFPTIATRPYPGVVLCKQCRLERHSRKQQEKIDAAQAALDAERARVKTFWTEATR